MWSRILSFNYTYTHAHTQTHTKTINLISPQPCTNTLSLTHLIRNCLSCQFYSTSIWRCDICCVEIVYLQFVYYCNFAAKTEEFKAQTLRMNAALHEMRAMLYTKELETRRLHELLVRKDKELEVLRSKLDKFQSVFFLQQGVAVKNGKVDFIYETNGVVNVYNKKFQLLQFKYL
jgi:hypothetical protein